LIDRGLATPVKGGRVVWAGRAQPRPQGALDGWNCDRISLLELLAEASELLVLDALSFPWESLRSWLRDIPVATVLPQELDVAGINAVLGPCLLSHITRFDRLIDPRAEVRRQLQARWPIADDCWITGAAADQRALWSVAPEVEPVAVTTPFGSFIALPGDLITEHLIDYGSHQRGLLNALLALIQGDDLFVDVGGHIGTIAIPVARRLTRGRTIVVEGSSLNYRLLAENVVRNDLADRIATHNVVLADAAAMRLPHLVPGNSGATSFTPGGSLGRRPDAVQTMTLDELLAEEEVANDSCVVKLDVEGNELSVLRGAEEFVRRANPILVIEVADAQLRAVGDTKAHLDAWLAARDYELYRVGGKRNFEGEAWVLEQLSSLRLCTDRLFDIVAVPRSSTRRASLQLEGSHAW
jgi:FkbM family methyltransferase